jgi:hypothetical protein
MSNHIGGGRVFYISSPPSIHSSIPTLHVELIVFTCLFDNDVVTIHNHSPTVFNILSGQDRRLIGISVHRQVYRTTVIICCTQFTRIFSRIDGNSNLHLTSSSLLHLFAKICIQHGGSCLTNSQSLSFANGSFLVKVFFRMLFVHASLL